MDYVVYCKKCAGICVWLANDDTDRKWVAREVGKLIREGRDVQRLSTEDSRKAKYCRCHRGQQALDLSVPA